MDYFENELKDLKKRIKWDFKDLKGEDEHENFTTPLVNVQENSENLVIKLVLPDVSRKEISLKISTNSVEVRAKKKIAVEVKKKGYHKVDTESLNYYRELDLPSPVDHKKAKVDFSNGLLKITIPKLQRKVRLKLRN